MAELVDAPDLGSGVLERESSSLSNPTNGLWCNDIGIYINGNTYVHI